MAAKRPSGSKRGRAAIDWEQAFLFYAALPPEQRDYQAVAEQFSVSHRTVERHGRDEHWRERARELDRASARVAAERLRDERAEKLVDTEKLIDATYVTYANQIVAGSTKITPNHIAKMFELRERIWARQDDETDGPLEQTPTQADPIDPTERKLQVLRALEDAGVLYRLLHPHQHNGNDEEHNRRGGGDTHDRDDDDRQEREVA